MHSMMPVQFKSRWQLLVNRRVNLEAYSMDYFRGRKTSFWLSYFEIHYPKRYRIGRHNPDKLENYFPRALT